MKKSNFERLIATANRSALDAASDAEGGVAAGSGAVGAAGAACGGACSCSARLAAAQRALLVLAGELRVARARLAAYEPQPG
ncbi:hypothetical protein RR46_02051 [Papilio xuthus]|uniref:Uncharacterized protein n=1 Tax=Papilio xuthus TaxID=66420 RepID=A0A194QKH1_PAPXU|nr:hypothetical protein RR46_02051 [Papilio xuthus]